MYKASLKSTTNLTFRHACIILTYPVACNLIYVIVCWASAMNHMLYYTIQPFIFITYTFYKLTDKSYWTKSLEKSLWTPFQYSGIVLTPLPYSLDMFDQAITTTLNMSTFNTILFIATPLITNPTFKYFFKKGKKMGIFFLGEFSSEKDCTLLQNSYKPSLDLR